MKHFRSLAKFYRNTFPELRLEIRTSNAIGSDYGMCQLIGDHFRVTLRRDLPECTRIAILIHEMGHALSWHVDEHPTEHGPLFGVGYSVAWRKYLEWLEG